MFWIVPALGSASPVPNHFPYSKKQASQYQSSRNIGNRFIWCMSVSADQYTKEVEREQNEIKSILAVSIFQKMHNPNNECC